MAYDYDSALVALDQARERIAELEALVWAAFCALDADEVERARELLSDACSKADLPKVTS